MLFERLFIQNLGIFTGEHTIDLLPKSRGKPIILVGALNGSGKTTVIESFQLALYGKRAKFGWRGTSAYPSYLAQVRNRHAKPADPTIAEITLKLSDGRRLRVRRQWDFAKDAPREYVSVYVGDNEAPDPTLSGAWDDEVERMLPARLSELFFFDGERIESLADPARSGDVPTHRRGLAPGTRSGRSSRNRLRHPARPPTPTDVDARATQRRRYVGS